MNIRFFTNRATGNLLADFRILIAAPWGEQSVSGCIIMGRDGMHRVMWPKAGEYFATTPATREQTIQAETMILTEYWPTEPADTPPAPQ